MDLMSNWKNNRTFDNRPFERSREHEINKPIYSGFRNKYRERRTSSERLKFENHSFKARGPKLLVYKEQCQVHGTFDEWYTHVVKASCVNDPKCQKPPPSMFIKTYKPGVWEKVFENDAQQLRNRGFEAIERLRKDSNASSNDLKTIKSDHDNSSDNSLKFGHGDEQFMKNNEDAEVKKVDFDGHKQTGEANYYVNKERNLPGSIQETGNSVIFENLSKITKPNEDVKPQSTDETLPDEGVEDTLKKANGPEIVDDRITSPRINTEKPVRTMDNLFKEFAALHYPDSVKREAFENYVRQFQRRYDEFNQLNREETPRKECIDEPNELEDSRPVQTDIRDLQDEFDVQEYEDELSGLKIMPKKLDNYDENDSYEYSKEYGDGSIPTDFNHDNNYEDRSLNRPHERVDSFQLYLNRLQSKEKKENTTWKERNENGLNDKEPSLHQGEIDEEIGDVQDISSRSQDNNKDYHERSGHSDEEKQYNEYAYPNNEFNDFKETFEESVIPKGMQEEEFSNEKPIYSEDIEPILIDEISSAVESEDNTEELDELENQPIVHTAHDIETEMSSEISHEEDSDSVYPIVDPTEQSRLNSVIVEDNQGPCEGEEQLHALIPEEESSDKVNGILKYDDTINSSQGHFTVPYRHIRKVEPSQRISYNPSSYRQRRRKELDWSKSSYLSSPKINEKFDHSFRRQSQPQMSTRCPLTQQHNQQSPEYFYRPPFSFSGYPSPMNSYWPSYFPSMINLPRSPTSDYSPGGNPNGLAQSPYFNPWITPFGNPWMYGFPWWLGFPPNLQNPFLYGAPPYTPPFPEMRAPSGQTSADGYGTTGYNWPTKRKTPRMTVYTTVPENHKEYNEKLCLSFDRYVEHIKNVAEKKGEEDLNKQMFNPTMKR